MQKILLIFLILFGHFLNADEYPSLHGGTFLNTILSDSRFLNNQRFPVNYTSYVSTNSAKSPTSGLPYYPQGWSKFKVYMPAGVATSISIATMPNATLRIHTKFRADTDNTINHFNPNKINDGYEFDSPAQTTAEGILVNTGQYYHASNSLGGWVYFDLTHDAANSYDEHPEYTGQVTLYISLAYTKTNNDNFNSWLNSTYFLTSMGDPSALVSSVNITDVTTQNTPSSRTISLDYGGALYDGTPISSASSSTNSSTASSSNSSSSCQIDPDTGGCMNSSSFSSAISSINSSVSSISCSYGSYLDPDTGGCVGGSSSSLFYSSSSNSSYFSASSVASCGILPGQNPCTSSSSQAISSTASSSNSSCQKDPDTGGCISNSSSSARSSSSSSSSTSKTSSSVSLTQGWNLVSIPIPTNEEIDVNTTLDGKATIAYKFDANTTSIWEKWVPGVAMKLKNGEGLFAGVPSSYGAPSLNFSVTADANNTTSFENSSYALKTWYLLGFGYDITVESIKTKHPNSVIFTMENGAYIRQDVNATTIKKGQGFWFKRYE